MAANEVERKLENTSHEAVDIRAVTYDGEGQIRALVESLPVVIWHLNPETFAFEFVSQGAEAILGYPSEEWIGNPTFWFDNLHPDDRNWASAFCRSATKAHKPHEFEYRMIARDGRTVWIRDIVKVVVQEGKPTKLVGVMIDVTRRHESERDRQSLEEQVRSAKRVEAFGELAAGVAHDFNNTFTAISMHADLLRNSVCDHPELVDSVDAIGLALQQGIDLTKSLLVVTRDMPTEKAHTDIRKAVEEARRMVWRVLPEGVTLLVDNPPDPPLWINGDAAKIQQLVLGLVLDARNSMSKGGTLSITLRPHVQEGSEQAEGDWGGRPFARLTISDRTLERSSSNIERSRDSEEHLKGSPCSSNAATLAIAENHSDAIEIVRNHGGSFLVDSAEQGWTIQIDLPCVQDPVGAATPAQQETYPPQVGLAKKIVLVAGDDQQVREVIAATLKDAGYHVVPLPDQAALENHFSEMNLAVNLLVLDLNRPKGAAIDFLQGIRARGHQTPAILLIGNKPPRSGSSPVSQATLIDKPVQMSSLVNLVQNVLERGCIET